MVGQHVGHRVIRRRLRLRGYDQFLMDCAADQDWVRAFFDIMLELDCR